MADIDAGADAAAAARRYFQAWDDHDLEAIQACFAADGTFQDPVTKDPVGADLVPLFAAGFYEAFPDARLPIDHLHVVAPDRVLVEFRMTGTHTGDSAMGPATDRSVDVPGVDVISIDPSSGLVRSVRGHWDMAGFLAALGLQSIAAPENVEGLIDFGLGVRVHTGRTAAPGCFTVTSADAEGADALWVNRTTEAIITELMELPGYLGSCLAVMGGRHFTFSAWDSPESAAGMKVATHREAMGDMLAGRRCTRIMTSLWSPLRLNTTKVSSDGGRAVPVVEPEPWL